MSYTLMNKDREFATLTLTENKSIVIDWILNKPEWLDNPEKWLQYRLNYVNRNNVFKALKLANMIDRETFLGVTNGISLTDTFWVKDVSSLKKWSSLNPYILDLNSVISEICLLGRDIGGTLRAPSPSYTLDGSADKCWKYGNNQLRLYKTSGEKWSGITGNRPYCEFYACQVANAVLPHAATHLQYGFSNTWSKDGKIIPLTYCQAFTSEKYSYVPMAFTPYSRETIEQLDSHLDTRSRHIIREMLILDSVILNYDRHMYNYGYLVDNDTQKIEGLAPIFDNDNSFLHTKSISEKDYREVYMEELEILSPKTEMGGWIDQARWSLTEASKMRMSQAYPFHFRRLPKEVDLDDARIEFMEYIVNSQIKAILGR